MSENKLRSNVLTKSSILTTMQPNIMSQTKTNLSSSLIVSCKTSSLESKMPELSINILERKKKLELETETEAKKQKTIELSSKLITKSTINNIKNSPSSHFLCTTNLMNLNSKLTTGLSTNMNNLLLKNNMLLNKETIPQVQSTHLMQKKIELNASLLYIKTETISHNKIEMKNPEKRSYSMVYSQSSIENEKENSFLLTEYLKVDNIINMLKHEEKSEAKRFKSLPVIPFVLVDNASNLRRQKNILINLVSSSLLRQPNFKNLNDITRNYLLKNTSTIIDSDPEFILKLALYTRRELNIRVTANFLISLAAFKEPCRPFLQRYFKSSVMLPSDWIDIAEQYQLFMDKKINFGSLPSALRKCMVEKFPDYDDYQLAKYNKEKSRSAKNSSLKDIKHVKSKLKDEQGNEKDVIEEKYIKQMADGLKINDRITIDIVVNSKCDTLKFDIIKREEIKNETKEFKPTVTRRGKPLNYNEKPATEIDETVAARIAVDYSLKRIVLKSCFKKTWSKRSDIVNQPKGFEFQLGFETAQFYIEIKSNCFELGFIDKNNHEIKLADYSHSKHNIELFKLNVFRISGVDIKLKDLKVVSKEKIGWDHQMSTEENEKELKQRSFTLKQLIRQLHISKPVKAVMSLLGKKYPSNFEDFIQSKLEGEYDADKAGKRMKLPIPETWETQVSMFGNKAEVWERLIDHKKLPYMAMLRNLRNMIKSGISEKHHNLVIRKLQDEGAVINSKQFPFRFFSAYEVLDELLAEFNNYKEWLLNPSEEMKQTKPKVGQLKRGAKKEKTKKEPSDMNYDDQLIKRYKTALDNALKVATRFNVSPIKGSTAIFINLGQEMQLNVGGSGKSLGKQARTIADIAALMGLMLKYACEYSKLNVYISGIVHKDIKLDPGTILDNMKALSELKNFSSNRFCLEDCFMEFLQNREHFDNLIILGNGVSNTEFHKSFLKKYRAMINKDLLFVNVNLSHAECGLMENLEFNHDNDISISGYSDSILRFIAERGNLGQLIHIENIDKSYDLPALKSQAGPTDTKLTVSQKIERSAKIPAQIVSHWKTIKVFISSTFKDMHSERDILMRTVFPVLRSKLAESFINVHEIDMRWGITEQEANNNQTLAICLNQIKECDYFIGILGNRYGMRLENYNVNADWLSSYSLGASITEIEFEAQIRKCKNKPDEFERSFFFFRDNNSFIDSVPSEVKSHFDAEDSTATQRLNALKARLKSKPFEILDGYTCKWHGLEQRTNLTENRALLTGLEKFAERVYYNLYNAIHKHYCNESNNNSKQDQLVQTNNAYIEAYASLFTGRQKLIIQFEKLLRDTTLLVQTTAASTEASKELMRKQNSIVNFVLCTAEAGCGKTTFICHYYLRHLPRLSQFNFAFSVGSFSGAEQIIVFLKCFCMRILSFFKFFQLEDFDQNSTRLDYYIKIFWSILDSFHSSSHSKTDRFYILIDGVDMFLDEKGSKDESFNWLPEVIPPSICFIFTARSTSQTKSILDKISFSNRAKNEIKLNLFEISTLDVLDKSEIVRANLEKFNKNLEDSPFNNQMKLLTGKRDSTNPLYLALACEELRVHNQFESLNSKLKELPTKANLMIQYVIQRLEKEYDSKLVNALFMFICCSKEGLTEQELYEILELYMNINFIPNGFEQLENAESIADLDFVHELFQKKQRIATQKYLSLLQTISETFLKPRSDSKSSFLSLKSHSLIESVLRLKYGEKSEAALNSKLTLQMTNRIMALYYWHQIDNKFEQEWTLKNQRAYIYLPFHLNLSNLYFDLSNVLCDLKFIAYKSELGFADLLMDDYDLNESSLAKNIFNSTNISLTTVNSSFKKLKISNKNSSLNQSIVNSKRFNDYKLFIATNYHIIVQNPSLIYQQAVNEAEDSSPAKDVFVLLRSNSKLSGYLFERLNKSTSETKHISKPITLNNFDDSVCSVAISKNGDTIACGTENCQIKLFSVNTAALIRTFQGHSGRINQLCFPNNATLVSVGTDGIASIWSVNAGFRIKVINNHNGHVVSGCTAEASGKTFMTCGWDCNVKIWDSNDGNYLGELKGHSQPVNCIVFSPDSFQVATGSWDSAIRIYNVVDRARKAVLRSHKTSIRSISYSSTGVFLASASIDGEVKLWNSKIGSNIASLKGHSMPVNSIRFSPNSQFLITGSSDRRVRVWSGSVGKIVRIIKDDSNHSAITCVCFNKNGEHILAGYHSGEIRMYETHTSCLKFKLKIHETPVRRIKYSVCNNFLLSSADNGEVKVLDVRNLKKPAASLLGNNRSVNALAINQYDIVITGTEDCMINVYEQLECMKELDDFMDISLAEVAQSVEINSNNGYPKQTLNAHKSPVTACVFNSTGEKFASSSKDAMIIIWSLNRFNLETNQLHTIAAAHSDWITDLAWSNSSEFILSASNDFSLKIWNAETGKETSKLTGHKANINSCSFQYGCAVSTSSDGQIKVWSHKGFEIASLLGHQGRVNACDLYFKIKTNKNKETSDTNQSWAEQVDENEYEEKVKNKKNEISVEYVYLVTASDDSTIRIWKPNESDWLSSLEKHNDKVNSVDLSETSILATASTDNTVNIFDMKNFFNEYLSGRFINSERLLRNHNSEITSIAFSKTGRYLFTSSSDGMLLVWECKTEEKCSISSIQFLLEIQAHERSLNKICVLNENEKFNNNSVTLATCSDDCTVKIWKITEDSKKNVSIESVKTITDKSAVFYIFDYETDKEHYLASFVIERQRIYLKVYDLNKNFIQSGNKGLQIVSFNDIIQQVKQTNGYLYINLVNNRIYKLNIEEIFNKMQIIIPQVLNKPVNYQVLTGESELNWYTCVNEQNGDTIAADCKGDLYVNSNTDNKLKFKRSLHAGRVSEIFSFKTVKNSNRFLTASQDCTVKMWTEKGEIQLGQYNTNAAITSIGMLKCETPNSKYSFVLGDQLGNLHLVVWHDQD